MTITHENNIGNWPQKRKEALETDAAYYFTGKPCSHGHTVLRTVQQGICTGCRSDKWRGQVNPVPHVSSRKGVLNPRVPRPEGYLSRIDAKSQGITEYFIGKPCLRGHIAKRYVLNGRCVECYQPKVQHKDYLSRDDADAQGLPTFFTGKVCSHGHLSPRYTVNGRCVECAALKAKQYKIEQYQREELKRIHGLNKPTGPQPFNMPGYGSLHPKHQEVAQKMRASGSNIFEICKVIKKSYFLVNNYLAQN